jgi:branched-chain amino acid transport system substrate-binding protein
MLVGGCMALSLGLTPCVHAQSPIRIGASLSTSGVYAPLGQSQLRGYQLCIKHANDKGGVLGRRLELLIEDDGSDPAVAARIYENLIVEKRVDAILGPYASNITEAVADVAEKHRKPMVASLASSSSIFRKGRRYVFMLQSPAEVFLDGFVDLAAKRGLKTIAVIGEDTLFPRSAAQGAVESAKRRGINVVLVEAYPQKTTDFTAILNKVKAANADALAAATYFDDAVAITRQMQALQVNPRMFGVTVGADQQKFYDALGKFAEYVYGATQWVPELATIRAGGLIPVAREYPGARDFVDGYRKAYPGADINYQAAGGYGGCEVLLDGIRKAGSVDGERLRAAISILDTNTVFGQSKVDQSGIQVAHKALIIQWQDGKKAIVWPQDLAPDKPRYPTPSWSQRK